MLLYIHGAKEQSPGVLRHYSRVRSTCDPCAKMLHVDKAIQSKSQCIPVFVQETFVPSNDPTQMLNIMHSATNTTSNVSALKPTISYTHSRPVLLLSILKPPPPLNLILLGPPLLLLLLPRHLRSAITSFPPHTLHTVCEPPPHITKSIIPPVVIQLLR